MWVGCATHETFNYVKSYEYQIIHPTCENLSEEKQSFITVYTTHEE